jgi:peptidoglycan/LPS O-acetylase OafA/YrhL
MAISSATHQGNNFDFVRIVAASMVLYSHHYALTGQMEPSFFGLYSIGGLAVVIFFIISGYLVMNSWWKDPNVLRFSLRRFLRIWPALTFVVVLTAYGLGTWMTELPARQYLEHGATSNYLRTLWMEIHYVLPGVFTHNPYPGGVNGSLWTIPYEVRCYIVLGIAGTLGLLKFRPVLLLCVAAFMAWFLSRSNADITGVTNYGRELSAFFLVGVSVCALEIYWRRNPLLWGTGVLLSFVVAWLAGWRHTAMLIGLPFLIIYAGTLATPIIRRAGRWGDPSYGIYLFAFPIQQVVIFYTWPNLGFTGTLCLAALLTIILAYASWHLIEKQALKLKPRKLRIRHSAENIKTRFTT